MGVCLRSLAALDRAVAAEVRRVVVVGGLSVSELARYVGVSQAHLHNWLGGRRRLSLSVLDVVVARLKLRPCDLLGCVGCGGGASGSAAEVALVVARKPPMRVGDPAQPGRSAWRRWPAGR